MRSLPLVSIATDVAYITRLDKYFDITQNKTPKPKGVCTKMFIAV